MSQELDKDQQAIILKVEKLLALANRKKGNEAEAAAAAAKAQEMLAAYNIDMAMVEQGSGSSGKREDKKMKGGVYLYQRDLWRACAELNFCMYWTSSRWESREVKRKSSWGEGRYVEDVWGLKYQHRVVGRMVNVKLTESTASYLEQTIERLVMDRLENQNNMRFSNWATSYRKGAATRIIEKIEDRRQELEEAEAERIRKAQHEASRAGTSSATALTLGDVRKSEREANNDFLYGEGWSAKMAERRRQAAEAAAEADREYTAWALANPEEARKEEARIEKENQAYWNRRRTRGGRTKSDNVNAGAYYAGYDEANSVGIDPQTDDQSGSTRRLT